MRIISFENFKNTDLYQDFIKSNPDVGKLKVQVFTAYDAIPVSDTEIIITKDIEEYRVVFYQGKTDSSGIIDNILLPAPTEEKSNEVAPKYTLYDLTAIHVGYEVLKRYSVGIFGNIKVIQYVKMIPDIQIGDNTNGN